MATKKPIKRTVKKTPAASRKKAASTSLFSKYRTQIIFSGVVLVLVLCALIFRGNSNKPVNTASNKNTVTIGLLAPMQGSNVTTGNDRKRALKLAKKDLNLQNVTINLVYRDSNCDAATAVNGFNDMIAKDHVIAVVGDDCSSSTLAVAKVANQKQVVLISPASTSPEITTAGDFVFRTVPSDAQQGEFATQLLIKDGKKRIAILHEDGAYGEGLALALTNNLIAKSVVIVDNQAFPIAGVEQTSQLEHIKSARPDAIYIISGDPSSDTAILLKIKELNINATLYGSEALKMPNVLSDAGLASNGLIVTALTDGTVDFKNKYLAEYGTDASNYVAQSYDAYYALAKAIASGARTGLEIKDKLQTIQFSGASGLIKFDANGDVSAGYEPVIAVDQKFTRYER